MCYVCVSSLCFLPDPPKHTCPYENCNFAVFEKSKLQQHIRIRHTEKVCMFADVSYRNCICNVICMHSLTNLVVCVQGSIHEPTTYVVCVQGLNP